MGVHLGQTNHRKAAEVLACLTHALRRDQVVTRVALSVREGNGANNRVLANAEAIEESDPLVPRRLTCEFIEQALPYLFRDYEAHRDLRSRVGSGLH